MKKSVKGRSGLEMPKKTAGRSTQKSSNPSKDTAMVEGIKKKYLKSKNVCKVTFTLPGTVAGDAEDVCIVGDFNNWDVQSSPMRKLRNGDYRIDMDLYPGSEYQFRYLINGSRWENAWNADKYVKTPSEMRTIRFS